MFVGMGNLKLELSKPIKDKNFIQPVKRNVSFIVFDLEYIKLEGYGVNRFY
jgi:hypothetical protein